MNILITCDTIYENIFHTYQLFTRRQVAVTVTIVVNDKPHYSDEMKFEKWQLIINENNNYNNYYKNNNNNNNLSNDHNIIDILYHIKTYYFARNYYKRLFNSFIHTYSDLGIYHDSYPFLIHICV